MNKTADKIWLPIMILAIVLVLTFSIVNLVNGQAIESPTILVSSLITTFPLVIVVVIGVAFIFGNGKKKKSSATGGNSNPKNEDRN